MLKCKKMFLVFVTFLCFQITYSQVTKSDTTKKISESIPSDKRAHRPIEVRRGRILKSLAGPAMMVGFGFAALENDGLKNINTELKEEIYSERPHKKVGVDNYFQFTPALAVYGLNALGIKGAHNLKDRSMIYLMSNIILTGTVFSLKNITKILRPDGSAYSSFPSGHTTEAFASAEFLRQEYKHLSPWYGIAGYTMAITTGYLRMYNNKHWFSDVVAGAGIGIASTKLAYWLYPRINNFMFRNKMSKTIVLPTYKGGAVGLQLVKRF